MCIRAEIAVNCLGFLITQPQKSSFCTLTFFAPRATVHRSAPRPNGPELSCGGEAPQPSSSLRGRSDHRRYVSPTLRGEIVDGYFRRLSDWLGAIGFSIFHNSLMTPCRTSYCDTCVFTQFMRMSG